MPHVLLKPGGSRSLWSVTGGGKWQPGVGPWHLSEVMEGSCSMEGSVPSFFPPHSMMDSISCDGRKSRPESTPHLQQVTLTGPWVTPPPKFPQGHRRAGRHLSPDSLAKGDVAVAQLWMHHLRRCLSGRSVYTFEGWDRKTACSVAQ